MCTWVCVCCGCACMWVGCSCMCAYASVGICGCACVRTRGAGPPGRKLRLARQPWRPPGSDPGLASFLSGPGNASSLEQHFGRALSPGPCTGGGRRAAHTGPWAPDKGGSPGHGRWGEQHTCWGEAHSPEGAGRSSQVRLVPRVWNWKRGIRVRVRVDVRCLYQVRCRLTSSTQQPCCGSCAVPIVG